jgi:hypothetical protein
MDISNDIKYDDKSWSEEVVAEGSRMPMLAIPFVTIARHFQAIFGPLIHNKIQRHPEDGTSGSVKANLPPGFHIYLFFDFTPINNETSDRKIIMQYLGDYATKLFDGGSFGVISKFRVNLINKTTKVKFEYTIFNSSFVVQHPRQL